MRIVICDDDKIDLIKIRDFCQKKITQNLEVLLYENPCDLAGNLQDNLLKNVDLFILDIEMPELSGIEIKKVIEEKAGLTSIIFLTSHSEMMEKAFGRNVIAFIRKNNWEMRLGEELSNIEKKNRELIIIHANNSIINLKSGQVITIIANDYYSNIIFIDDKENNQSTKNLLCKKSLKQWELELDKSHFCRISRKAIINFENVRECQNDCFIMLDGEKYFFPRGKFKMIRNKYYDYIFEKEGAV